MNVFKTSSMYTEKDNKNKFPSTCFKCEDPPRFHALDKISKSLYIFNRLLSLCCNLEQNDFFFSLPNIHINPYYSADAILTKCLKSKSN